MKVERSAPPATTRVDLVTCPECRGPAEVDWRDVLDSTDGPVEHAKIRCVRRHWFLLPVASLVPVSDAPGQDRA